MSQAHIEQFYAIAAKDQALLNKMLAGTTGPEGFVANAVKEGQVLGYGFTVEEAAAWIKRQQEIKSSGELSDSQLETVAGGKHHGVSSVVGTVGDGIKTGWGQTDKDVTIGLYAATGGLHTGATAVDNWMNSW